MQIDVIYSEGVIHLKPLADDLAIYIEDSSDALETSYFAERD